MDLFPLISILSDGQFHSGSALGKQLGVSRTAIWKALDGLSAYALEFESHKGKGYCLTEPLDLLDPNTIDQALRQMDDITVVTDVCVDSSNSELARRFPSYAGGLYVLLVEQQTQGRGRRGRRWTSPFAKNIYLSLGFDLQGGPEVLQGLSIVIGVAVVNCLQSLGVSGLGLKWPNDVYMNGRKLAGILVELEGEMAGTWRVTAGLGLNVNMVERDAIGLGQPWATIDEQIGVGRSELAGALIVYISEHLSIFREAGFASFVSAFNQVDELKDKEVDVLGPELVGIAKGIDAGGLMLLQTDAGMQRLNSGEVSVRVK